MKKNKKRILIISIIIFVIILGLIIYFIFFNKPKEQTVTLKYETRCENFNSWYKPREDGVTSTGFQISFYYDDLDDNKTYEEFYGIIYFDNMENAENYYNELKYDENEFELEIKQDEDGTPMITMYDTALENETPKKVIEEQEKEEDFTCENYDTGRTFKLN